MRVPQWTFTALPPSYCDGKMEPCFVEQRQTDDGSDDDSNDGQMHGSHPESEVAGWRHSAISGGLSDETTDNERIVGRHRLLPPCGWLRRTGELACLATEGVRHSGLDGGDGVGDDVEVCDGRPEGSGEFHP